MGLETADYRRESEVMQKQAIFKNQDDRIAASVPFVQALARRLAVSMPHSIDIGDLVQDGMIERIAQDCQTIDLLGGEMQKAGNA